MELAGESLHMTVRQQQQDGLLMMFYLLMPVLLHSVRLRILRRKQRPLAAGAGLQLRYRQLPRPRSRLVCRRRAGGSTGGGSSSAAPSLRLALRPGPRSAQVLLLWTLHVVLREHAQLSYTRCCPSTACAAADMGVKEEGERDCTCITDVS